MSLPLPRPFRSALALAAAVVCLSGLPGPLQAQQAGSPAYRQAVAEASYGSEAIAAFYRLRDYQPIFTGPEDAGRRAALLAALENADVQGLPVRRYDPDMLRAAFAAAGSPRARGEAEVLAAMMLVQYAQDLQSGVLDPRRIDSGIVRDLPRRDPFMQLQAFAHADPVAFLRSLPPATREYNRLLAERLRLEEVVRRGDWGPQVAVMKFGAGQSGENVVDLRDRLVAMGYMKPSATPVYDDAMRDAVRQFQTDHGLTSDGVAGTATVTEINVPAHVRLGQVLVAMERERWTNIPRGDRHIEVNIPEFTARIIEDGKTTFSTRVVVGKNTGDRRTPEFSDQMEFMVVNPSWSVPRSITTKEYLPMLQRNPNAVSHLKLVDSRGRAVSRGSVNFAKYNARNFPFRMSQPPSKNNALGQVKFMFPNRYNIYLHDTPSKGLFAHDSRAYSHGCVRVADPFDLAYALLSAQTDDPEGLFQSRLRSGAEARVNLETPLPVHILYRTAFSQPKGQMNYRADVYGRDARIWTALQQAGVSLPAAGS
ncbi:L,D-transpeptidase family protein [Tropicimonas sp.]|uniref:L,D-transpeptidase family protein n=1 Tax=Tropicimonas sp. TaxID=2067044 RepID=UPI003A879E42